MNYLTFNNGVKIPQLGLGVFLSTPGVETLDAVRFAIESGYRHIDTAQIYRNEESVGQAIKDSGINREDIFVTTKVWNEIQRTGSISDSIDESLKKMNMEYIDLLLIHWPVKEKYVNTWLELEKIYGNGKGKIRAIGVSNFLEHHIQDIEKVWSIVPAINQYELHPELNQKDLRDFCSNLGIISQAYSPLGGSKNVERVLSNSILMEISKKYDKTPAQIILRWNIQLGIVTIPKSITQERIKSNFEIFDFELTKEDMEKINSINKNERHGANPDTFTF